MKERAKRRIFTPTVLALSVASCTRSERAKASILRRDDMTPTTTGLMDFFWLKAEVASGTVSSQPM